MKKTEFGGHVLVDTHAHRAAEQTAQRASIELLKPNMTVTPLRCLHENFDGRHSIDAHFPDAVDGAGQHEADDQKGDARPEPNGGHHFFETHGGSAANGDGRAIKFVTPNVTMPAVADPIENDDGQGTGDTRCRPAITNGGGHTTTDTLSACAPADPTIRAAKKGLTPTSVLPLTAGARRYVTPETPLPPPTPQAAAIDVVIPMTELPLQAMTGARTRLMPWPPLPPSSPPTQTKGVKLCPK